MANASASDWTEDDLSRQVVLALGFAKAVLDDIDSTADSPLGRIAQKVVAETAMLLYAVAPLRATHPELETACARLASRLVSLARGTAVQAAICLDPGKALDHAMAHILLDRLGHADAAFDSLLQGAQQLGRQVGPERLPHRLIEQAWLEQIWPCGAPSRRRQSEAVAASALGRPLDALKASRADIYAFTHSVLYASDMGRQKLASARRRRDIEADALVALGFALDAEDCDLTVEVLWTWPMLGLRWHPAALFALKGLIERQDSLGFLPGIGFDAQRLVGMSPEQRDRHVRQTCYHTVYVMGFLCAAALRSDRLQHRAARPTKRGTSRGAGAALLELLRSDNHHPEWCTCMAGQSAELKDAAAPLLLSVLVKRAAEASDLPRLRLVLNAALQCGLADRPAPVQAAALLLRAQCLAEGLVRSASAAPDLSAVSAPASRALVPDCAAFSFRRGSRDPR
ncbi:MAG: DUF6895 family protein [Reyranella sp.]